MSDVTSVSSSDGQDSSDELELSSDEVGLPSHSRKTSPLKSKACRSFQPSSMRPWSKLDSGSQVRSLSD